MNLVLDASMSLAWLLKRQKVEEINCAEKVLSALGEAKLTIVPALWHTEIGNALLIAERRRVVTEAQVVNYLNRLDGLPIVTDDIEMARHRDIIMSLAREYNLTTYDAHYFDLALRHEAVLATFDIELANAMRKAGGKVFQ